MLNYLCKARSKKHGEVRPARTNFNSIPGFAFFPYPACTVLLPGTLQISSVMRVSSVTSCLPTILWARFSKREHGELLKHRVKRVEYYVPSLGSFLSHVLKGGGERGTEL